MAKTAQVKEWNVSTSSQTFHSRHAPPHVPPLSPWSGSAGKRCFDLVLVLAALPIVAPLCLLIAIAVRVSSRGPAFFLQKRIGRDATTFVIVKFRTMIHRGPAERANISTIDDDHITAVGKVLRYWKLDELPQLFNVLRGEMSLVGPRPRVPDQPTGTITCRPGITGAASLVFAREDFLLAGIPSHQRNGYYANRVLPLKRRLDDAYMARATFSSDVRLILLTILRVWISMDQPRSPSAISAHRPEIISTALPGESCD